MGEQSTPNKQGHFTVAIKSPQRKGITEEYSVTAAGVSWCLSRLRHMLCAHYSMDLNDNEIQLMFSPNVDLRLQES